MKRPAILLALACALLLAALTARDRLLSLPPADAPAASGFDTARALGRLARILGDERPHPVDTEANDAVRMRLVAELAALGLDAEVDDAMACNGSRRSRTVSCARVRNVTARLGPAEGAPLILAAHYDSSPLGPGAADDGIGIAVMLETAAHLARRPLARPVVLLFTDGEEAGLIGARAFLERDPLAAQAGALLNFEARGVTGPAVMFETDDANGAAVHALRRAAARPVANSLMADMGRLIPNSTDVEVLRERDGLTILNFAIIGNEALYHTAGDRLAALDPASVRHMGDQALALAGHLAAMAGEPARGQRLYMDVAGRWLVTLPAWLGHALLAGLVLFLAVESRRRGAGRPLAIVLAALAAAAALTFIGQQTVLLLRGGGDIWRAWPIATGFAIGASALAASLAALALLARGIEARRLAPAFWLVFAGLGGIATLIAPGAAILFLPGPLAAALAMLGDRRWPGTEAVGMLIAALILFLLFAPLLALSEALLRHGAAWQFAPVAALILLPFLILMRSWAEALPARGTAMAAGALALAAWLPASLVPAYGAERPQHLGIEYLWDADAGTGHWLILHDGARLPAAMETHGFQRGFKVPFAARRRMAAEAPPLPIAPPALALLGTRAVPQGRMVRLRIAANGATTVLLRLPPEAEARIAGVPGFRRPFGRGASDSPFWLRCTGRSCDGQVFDLLLGAAGPIEADLAGLHPGLPAEAAPLVSARPAQAGPQYQPDARHAARKVRF